jgi:biofilm PGA synthesis N-glycosyltransferase PgaC
LANTGIIVGLASILFVLYVIALYPILLAFLARGKRVSSPPCTTFPTVSVILPVHNGAAFIRAKLDTLAHLDYPPEKLRVLVISDGSTDGTDELVRADGRAELIRVPRGGKPAALTAGIARATGEILFFTDVRQDLSPNSLRDLVAQLEDPGVGVATGELVIRGGASDGPGLYWQYEVWIRSNLSRLGVLQGATGCIYAMRREYAVAVPEHILADDVFLPLAAYFRGKRIVLDMRAKAFDYPTELGVEFRRKVRTLAGMYQIVGAYPRLLAPGSRGAWHFASHKLGRLLLPFALLALLFSSLEIPPPYGTILLAGQVVVYAAGLLGLILPRSSPVARITNPAGTFLVLMAAAFCAAFALFIPSQRLWKQTAIRTPQN